MTWIDERGAALSKAILEKTGNDVLTGPFKGVKFNFSQHAGNFAPYLLGTYENEVWPIIEKIFGGNYKTIFNVGCSFGYYAVGLATKTQATVLIKDLTDDIEQACIDNGKLNNVDLKQSAYFDGMAIADLIIMDIEGTEEDHLLPLIHDYSNKDLLVECHECMKPGLTQIIVDRFKETHDITLINNKSAYFDLNQIFGDSIQFEHFDAAIVTHEGRAGITPWLWMTHKCN